jgi:hypothetical protein
VSVSAVLQALGTSGVWVRVETKCPGQRQTAGKRAISVTSRLPGSELRLPGWADRWSRILNHRRVPGSFYKKQVGINSGHRKKSLLLNCPTPPISI